MLIKRWKAYFFVTFPLTFTHNSRHGAKTGTDVLPLDKTTQGLIVLFPFDTAEGGIMGLLQATCIMPNSLRSLFSSLVIQSSSSQQPTGGIKKKKKKRALSLGPLCVRHHFHPQMTPSLPRDGGEDLGTKSRGEEGRGPM